MTQRIYLDNNATTPLLPNVVDAMLGELRGAPSNASSVHSFGRDARALLEGARSSVANHFGYSPREVTFTSSATEALNWILRMRPYKHIVTSDLDHSCIYETCKTLEASGTRISYISPGIYGAPTVELLDSAITSDTELIILSAANSETGVLTDLDAIASLAEDYPQAQLIIDGVALVGKLPVCVPKGVSSFVLSAHKFHGPKGAAALLHRKPITPVITGGGQERGMRAGTENLSGIIGLQHALEAISEEHTVQHLRDTFECELKAHFPEIEVNGEGPRLPNTSNLHFPGVSGETLLIKLDQAGIAASHGSACSAGSLEPSRVLLNMGYSRERARSSVRFSFSRLNTNLELEYALSTLKKIL